LKEVNVTVVVGEGVVTVKREGSNRALLANILGTVEADGIEVLCLDRLVHDSHEKQFGEWTLAGAVTTLLSRSRRQDSVVSH
jgi:RNase P/RNase MRP subunit POP5